jgi:hypothetical protein
MAENDITSVISEKSKDIKKMFKDLNANLEQWKFSMEETGEGIRVELHAVALVKKKGKE